MTSLSAIIPTWCEADAIVAAVRGASRIADEVIVADGGSPDATLALAQVNGARVVTAGKGRGVQLSAGAQVARGDVLLFLHADAALAPEARAAILRRLADPSVVGGNFLLEFEGPSRFATLFSHANDLRRRFLSIYYGDSAIFVRRTIYEELGGFRPFPIFEDHEFVQRLERRGPTVYIRDVRVRVSSRRYERAPWRTLATWGVLHGLYSFAGVSPDRLATYYNDLRTRSADAPQRES